MTNAVDFIINLKGNISQQLGDATQHAKQLESNLGGVQSMAGKIASTLGIGFAVFEGISFVKKGVEKFKELEEVTAKVEANLRSTGEKAGVSMEMIEGFSKNLSGKIQASRVEILDMSSQLLTFPAITKDVFQSSMGLVADIAKQTGHGLSETAIMYGKALNDPTDGLQKMMRYGVMFTEQEKAKITTLQASGDLIGAQKFMMQAIATSGYAGVAEAMFNSDPIAKFNKMMGGAQVAIGEIAVDALKKIMPYLETFAGGLKSAGVWIKENKDILLSLGKVLLFVGGVYATYKGILSAILLAEKAQLAIKTASAAASQLLLAYEMARAEGMGIVTAAQWALNVAMSANPISLVVLGVAAFIAGIIALTTHFGSFSNMLKSVWDIIKAFGVGVVYVFANVGKSILGALTLNPKMIKEGVQGAIKAAKDAGTEIAEIWNRPAVEAAKKKSLVPKKETGTNSSLSEIATTDEKGTKNKGAKSVEGKKNIQITVTYNAPLIQDFTISSTNITDGLESLKNKVSEILVGATHDTLLVADH